MNLREVLRKAVDGLMQMNGNSVLLDTNIVISHFRGFNENIQRHLEAEGKIFIPLTVFGELMAGAYRSKNKEKSVDQIHIFLKIAALLIPDEITAIHYGEIYAEMADKGTPIPQNDLWIAALAREHQIPLVTRDQHFDRIRDMKILKW